MTDHELSAANLKARRPSMYKVWTGLSLILLAALGVGLILVSPLALNWIGGIQSLNWSRLSNIGQTYGAISAVIAGVALAAIAISLVLQSRSLGLTRMEIMRSHQHDLIKFTIEHPILLSGWGYKPPANSGLEDAQIIGFVSMLIGFWRTSYEGRMIRDEELRQNLAQVFDGEAGRRFWANSRDSYLKSIDGSRSRRFVSIIDDEFKKAEKAGPPLVGSTLWSEHGNDESATVRRSLFTRRGGAIALGFGVGILVARALRHIGTSSSNR